STPAGLRARATGHQRSRSMAWRARGTSTSPALQGGVVWPCKISSAPPRGSARGRGKSPSGGSLRRPATERQSLVNRVKALAEALEGSDVGELDLTENGLRIYIRRRLDAVVVAVAGVRGRRRATRSADARAALAGSPAPDPTVAVVAP